MNIVRKVLMKRQALILKRRAGELIPEEKAEIEDIESSIIQAMTDAGASQDAINAAISGFANANMYWE